MKTEEMLSFLSSVNLFVEMERGDLELLMGLCEQVEFGPDEVLIEEGQIRPPFQILVEGSVRVVLPKDGGSTRIRRSDDVKLNTLSRGRCFGEYSLLEGMPASASVVGEEKGSVLRIAHDQLHNLIATDDRLARIVYRNMLTALVGRLKRRESEIDRTYII